MFNVKASLALLVIAFDLFAATLASPVEWSETRESDETCKKTKVAVLGAGCAGIFAAQALHNASIDDFVIIEYNGEIGGRVKHTTFGQQPDGEGPYTIELGANWCEALSRPGLAKKWKLENKYSNYDNLSTFDETGQSDYSHLIDDFLESYTKFEQDAGLILTQNLQDRSARTGFRLADWKPTHDSPKMQAVEWFEMDFEYAQTPEQTSHTWAVINYNSTFYQYSERNNFVFDERGFSAFISGEASTFLEDKDPRLMLNTIVTDIEYSDTGVTVHNKDGSCVEADYVICTFSIGVLQRDRINFQPKLPEWKQTGIDAMTMATYTKIFLQFPPDQVFWDTNTQFFLYADPYERGYYPIWQSLDTPGFQPGSGILFVTVTQDQSFQVESQTEEMTKNQVMEVLRTMYGAENVPEPTAFMYPRWSKEPWAYGSYSNWPPSYTLEMHQNLRASLGNGRLWFAGEATSTEYFGFLHGAYAEGQSAGIAIAECIHGNATACDSSPSYKMLHGTTRFGEYDVDNGWTNATFETFGL
ncbi:hypothetical protein LTR37_018029 [Vermiconidia calcicola]|uniref:Uncharacterized protein n=1 Tax=Vermiconidia calcicola TaxID=1690605 RepID=A0ACC3MI21_9PEZI|nr:hypothetical protein LTR37_018029 [Vermiconidia calcicola]